jgi:5-oxoprolinase (ATP-hydrolysing) subunit A
MTVLNLNADLGESYGAWRMGADEAMLDIVNSANVACGFHAGDPLGLRRTLAQARERGVSVGAHPSFPDLQGFGRRRIEMPHAEVQAMVIYQVGALQALARSERLEITHVKPHGALNNMACEDRALADAVAQAVRTLDPQLLLMAPALSQLAAAGRAAGLCVIDEVFADRAYAPDGSLAPRSQPGAVLHDSGQCVAHVLAMVREGGLRTAGGITLPTPFQSICVHGDNAHAVQTARAVADALRAHGHVLQSLPSLLAR